MLEVAICDDDKEDLDKAALMLDKILSEYQVQYQIRSFLSANELLNNNDKIDIGILDISMEELGVTSQAEVTQAVDTLLSHGVDCLSNLTDNNVVGVLGAILEKTDEAGIPVYGSEVEQVKLGCVGGAGLDYIQLGIQTGLMAAKVLTGEAACEDLPYETIENYGLYINSDAAAELGITIPDDIAQEAQECAE